MDGFQLSQGFKIHDIKIEYQHIQQDAFLVISLMKFSTISLGEMGEKSQKKFFEKFSELGARSSLVSEKENLSITSNILTHDCKKGFAD